MSVFEEYGALICSSYHTVHLGFSKLQEKLVVKYPTNYIRHTLKKDQ